MSLHLIKVVRDVNSVVPTCHSKKHQTYSEAHLNTSWPDMLCRLQEGRILQKRHITNELTVLMNNMRFLAKKDNIFLRNYMVPQHLLETLSIK